MHTNTLIKIYLVGGIVRDELLNFPSKDRDWVVVGATPDIMESVGFLPVGQDFPVYINPESKEEYALARQERKKGTGYKGFSFNASTEVTLHEDLRRRDFTINAIAKDHDGVLIDPYSGAEDIKRKIIRHVSEAFSEDPLRLLRAARFAARFHALGFSIATETYELLKKIAASGELLTISAERIWVETYKALVTEAPQVYFEVLRDTGALTQLFPEIDALFGVPQPPQYHPEVDTGIHTMMTLTMASQLSKDPLARFGALLHDLGKAITPKEKWPSHRGHETLGIQPINDLCHRIKAPNAYQRIAEQVSKYHTDCHKIFNSNAEQVVKLIEKLDAFRNPTAFNAFLLACEADARGRTGFENNAYPQANFLREAFKRCKNVSAQPFLRQKLSGKEIGDAMREQRIKGIAEFMDRDTFEKPKHAR